MKNVKSVLLAVLFVIVSTITYAQTSPKVIAIVNHASWCPSCQSNGDRISKEVMSKLNSSEVKVLVNDLSDEKSKAASAVEIKKLGILELVQAEPGSGQILLFDAKTKRLINKLNVGLSSEEINKAIKTALKG